MVWIVDFVPQYIIRRTNTIITYHKQTCIFYVHPFLSVKDRYKGYPGPDWANIPYLSLNVELSMVAGYDLPFDNLAANMEFTKVSIAAEGGTIYPLHIIPTQYLETGKHCPELGLPGQWPVHCYIPPLAQGYPGPRKLPGLSCMLTLWPIPLNAAIIGHRVNFVKFQPCSRHSVYAVIFIPVATAFTLPEDFWAKRYPARGYPRPMGGLLVSLHRVTRGAKYSDMDYHGCKSVYCLHWVMHGSSFPPAESRVIPGKVRISSLKIVCTISIPSSLGPGKP
jgi:hypothetical protein